MSEVVCLRVIGAATRQILLDGPSNGEKNAIANKELCAWIRGHRRYQEPSGRALQSNRVTRGYLGHSSTRCGDLVQRPANLYLRFVSFRFMMPFH